MSDGKECGLDNTVMAEGEIKIENANMEVDTSEEKSKEKGVIAMMLAMMRQVNDNVEKISEKMENNN